jgi:hypothetical protein
MVWQNKLDSELHQDFFLSLFCVGAVLWVIWNGYTAGYK